MKERFTFRGYYLVKQQHRMFWNIWPEKANGRTVSVKQQHRMFWNILFLSIKVLSSWVKQQHRMFWNTDVACEQLQKGKLNNNIGCFEILNFKESDNVDGVKQQHRMFWNKPTLKLVTYGQPVKQQHRMFWNPIESVGPSVESAVKQQHRMFWNYIVKQPKEQEVELNNNIGCFEMSLKQKD